MHVLRRNRQPRVDATKSTRISGTTRRFSTLLSPQLGSDQQLPRSPGSETHPTCSRAQRCRSRDISSRAYRMPSRRRSGSLRSAARRDATRRDARQTISRIHRLRCQAARIIFGVTRHVSAMRCRGCMTQHPRRAGAARGAGGRFKRWTPPRHSLSLSLPLLAAPFLLRLLSSSRSRHLFRLLRKRERKREREGEGRREGKKPGENRHTTCP